MRHLKLEEASHEGLVFCGVTYVVFMDEDEVRLVAVGNCEVIEIREMETAREW